MRIDWDRYQPCLELCGRVRCEPGWRLAPQWSQRLRDFDLWLVWAGRGTMRIHSGHITLRPGICLWMRPGGRYEAEQDLDDRLGVTFLHFDLVDGTGGLYPAAAPLPPEVYEFRDVHYANATLRRAVELAGPARRPAPGTPAGQIAAALVTAMLMEIDAGADSALGPVPAGTDRHHHDLVLRLASRITEAPHEVPPVAELARRAGYSPDHFTRIFKTVLGQAPQDFVLQARLNRARHLLAESSLSITQIADVLGYSNVFFFSRQFKRKTGQTPLQYRRRGR